MSVVIRSPGPRRSRSPALVSLAVLGALVVTGLSLATWQASRRGRAATDAYLRGYAALASQRLATRFRDEIYVASNFTFSRLRAGRAGVSGRPADPLALLLAGNQALIRCECTAPLAADFVFRLTLPGQALETRGPVTPDSLERAAAAAWISAHARELGAARGWDFALLPPAEGARAILIARPTVTARDSVVYGFAFDAGLLRTRVVSPLLRGTDLVDGAPPAKGPRPVVVRVRRTDGAGVIYADSAWSAQPPAPALIGSAAVGPLFGDLTIESVLTPPWRARLTADFPALPVALLMTLTLITAAVFAVALRLLARTQSLAAQRADFTSSVSHELRTPLTQILLSAETLVREGRPVAPEARRRAVDAIIREARRLLRLVQNLLQHARAERAGGTWPADDLALADLARDVVEDFQLLAWERDATVRFLDHSEGARVRVDADAARQVIVNLLDNAVRYGPRGQTITVSLAVVDGRVTLTVDDQGPGIAPADRERIWAPYERVLSAVDPAPTGSGIGLAVVRAIMARGGGWATVEPGPEGGARFTVAWPAAPRPVARPAPAGVA